MLLGVGQHHIISSFSLVRTALKARQAGLAELYNLVKMALPNCHDCTKIPLFCTSWVLF